MEYRQLAKLKSTYADGLANFIGPDGRIHGKFHQTVTATGRLSSSEPNLQNIPVRVELGRLIRKVFVPEEGYVFVDADYSQIELRVLAHCSGDPNLIQAYREARDIHRICLLYTSRCVKETGTGPVYDGTLRMSGDPGDP